MFTTDTFKTDLETFYKDFKALRFIVAYSFDETEDQLDTLNKLILIVTRSPTD